MLEKPTGVQELKMLGSAGRLHVERGGREEASKDIGVHENGGRDRKATDN